jgi:hypothetical protein
MPHSAIKLGWTWTVQLRLRSHRKRAIIQLNLRYCWKEREAGVRLNLGVQTIRLIFDEPQKLRRILLVFEDTENSRTQEFVLRWSPDIRYSSREIVRQQWNFSPPDSVRETEDYPVELSEVKVLELEIVPDKSGGEVPASLMSLRLA